MLEAKIFKIINSWTPRLIQVGAREPRFFKVQVCFSFSRTKFKTVGAGSARHNLIYLHFFDGHVAVSFLFFGETSFLLSSFNVGEKGNESIMCGLSCERDLRSV